jgi:hypothetical protein
MRIADILNRIDSGAVALPEFQRPYVWTRPQVRDLVRSLYLRHPVGSLLYWETASDAADARGDAELQRGHVHLLLDGQQRITSLYGLARGQPPPFFDGDRRAFSDLRFHVEQEEFAFYAPVRMRDDPLWLDVGGLLRHGPQWAINQLQPALAPERLVAVLGHINKLYAILDTDLHGEHITGPGMTVDVVVELFNKVNSGGTKLSKGDLALAKLCASWPQARVEMNGRLDRWRRAGFSFTLDWLLRNVNAVVTGRAEFSALAEVPAAQFRDGLHRAERAIDAVLNLISTRLGLDHARVLGAVGALPLMTRFLAERGGRIDDQRTADKLLFWYVHCLLWGRYAGSTETVLNVDLQAISEGHSDHERLDRLIGRLRQHRGDLRVEALDFEGHSRGARFYPLLYMLTRVGRARDLGSGLELRQHLLGQHSALEVHHLFPKAVLQRHGHDRRARNALANFAFLTQETNRSLGDRHPREYFARCESQHPGVLASHWIPSDPALWAEEQYDEFLSARRELLAGAANALLDDLLHGRGPVLAGVTPRPEFNVGEVGSSDEEEEVLVAVQEWLSEHGLQPGIEQFALLGLDGAEEEAILDLAWPDGLRYGGEKLALLIHEPEEVKDAANRHGYRYCTSFEELRELVHRELLIDAA